jgi:hypothetical protein
MACGSGEQAGQREHCRYRYIRELPPQHHLRLGRTLPSPPGLLPYGPSTSQEMEDEERDPHEEKDVNESSRNVKCEKPK